MFQYFQVIHTAGWKIWYKLNERDICKQAIKNPHINYFISYISLITVFISLENFEKCQGFCEFVSDLSGKVTNSYIRKLGMGFCFECRYLPIYRRTYEAVIINTKNFRRKPKKIFYIASLKSSGILINMCLWDIDYIAFVSSSRDNA